MSSDHMRPNVTAAGAPLESAAGLAAQNARDEALEDAARELESQPLEDMADGWAVLWAAAIVRGLKSS